VTIRDVARASGTSITTVSVALSGGAGVAEATRARVVAAANRLGWRPNRRASALRRLDPRLVGLVYEVEQDFQAMLVDAVYTAGAANGLEVTLSGATRHHRERRCVAELLRDNVQALLLTGSELTDGDFAHLARELPVMSLCRFVRAPGVDAVVSDDQMALGQAIGHLRELGHREIAHVDGGDVSTLSARRRQAYASVMEEQGLSDRVRVVRGGSTLAAGAAAAHALIGEGRTPTAVVCYNDMVAAGLSRTLRQLGLRVPEDVSVVGFDDGPTAADPTTDLTTIVQDIDGIAAAAMGLLARRIAADALVAPGQEELVVMPTRLVVRSTTGPVRLGS
jgi:DNA-binding LacI/PurR family transcriptional regulator